MGQTTGRPGSGRLASYLRGLGWALAVALIALGVLAVVQELYHPFDAVLARADAGLAKVDTALGKETLAGISMGSLVLTAAVAALPLFRKGVRRRQYGVSFWRGILSSAIFLGTDKLYRYARSVGTLYLSATIALFLAATIVLVEIVSRVGKAEDEADTRTELLASIVSGLAFGLLLQIGEYALSLAGR